MVKKRIKIDLKDNDGVKYNFNLEGDIDKNKIIRIFELMDLLNIKETHEKIHNRNSIGSMIWNIINKYFFSARFTSTMVLEKFEDEYNKPIKLSIVSTYLARFFLKDKILRSKSGREWTYEIRKLVAFNS